MMMIRWTTRPRRHRGSVRVRWRYVRSGGFHEELGSRSEVRREDDGELLGFVISGPAGAVPRTVFGSALGEPQDDEESARSVVESEGLNYLADRWLLCRESSELQVRIVEASPLRVVVQNDDYGSGMDLAYSVHAGGAGLGPAAATMSLSVPYVLRAALEAAHAGAEQLDRPSAQSARELWCAGRRPADRIVVTEGVDQLAAARVGFVIVPVADDAPSGR